MRFISGHLEPPQCFAAEIYAVDLGVQEADDVKLNFGEQMLLGLLRQWSDMREALAQEQWGGQVGALCVK